MSLKECWAVHFRTGVPPADKINKMTSKMNTTTVIIVTDYFPPDPGNRARRMLERAQYLIKHDVHVIVLCPQRENLPVEIEKEGIRIIRISPWMKNICPNMDYSKYHLKWYGGILGPFLPILGFIRWVVPCISTVRQLRHIQPILYSVNNPLALHLVGLFGKKYCRKWIAELRDPIVKYEFSHRGIFGIFIDKIIEKLIIEQADIVCLRQGLQVSIEELQERYPDYAYKLRGLPDYGVNLNDLQISNGRKSNNSEIKGIFAGNFYGDTSPNEIVYAVDILRREGANIVVSFYGGWSDRFIQSTHASYKGKVSYWDLLEVYNDMDFTIVIDHSRSSKRKNNFIPSKMCELIGLRKPILVIGSRDSLSAKLVLENNLGYFAENRRENIAHAIRELIEMINKKTFNFRYYHKVKNIISNEKCEAEFLKLVQSE